MGRAFLCFPFVRGEVPVRAIGDHCGKRAPQGQKGAKITVRDIFCVIGVNN